MACSWSASIRSGIAGAPKPFYHLRFSVLEPTNWAGRAFSARLYCTPRRCGSSAGSCAISVMTPSCSAAMRLTKKPDRAARSGEAPPASSTALLCQPGCLCARQLGKIFDRFPPSRHRRWPRDLQLHPARQYLACPLRYRYRYLDGWQEKETRAGLLFGRAFEQALAALFRREDPGCALFEAWSQYKNSLWSTPRAKPGIRCLSKGSIAHAICPG